MTTNGLLQDKVVLITGASTGIGADAARVLSDEGATVVLAARSADRLAELTDELTASGAPSSYVTVDVSDPAQVQRMIDTTVERHGRLDGAFNNAGISQGGRRPLAEVPEDVFDRVLAVDLKAVWLCCAPRSPPCWTSTQRARSSTPLASAASAAVPPWPPTPPPSTASSA